MAIVSLSNQRGAIYDADGWILRAPVSGGQTGYETPAGVYSIIQKEEKNDRCLTTISQQNPTTSKALSVRSNTSYYK